MSATEILHWMMQAETLMLPVMYAVAVMLIIAESVLILRKKWNPDVREARVSVISGILAFGGLFLAARLYSFALMSWIFQFRIFEMDLGWFSWILCFVLYDLIFYINHVLGHKVRLLWCIHQVHHSSQRMRLASGVRGSMFDFLVIPWFYAWLPVLGIHPLIVVITEVYSKFWGLLVHVNENIAGRLGFFEKFLVTPVMHRIHHAKNTDYLDTNFGEVLNIWDRLFKTYRTETTNEKIIYGLTRQIDSGSFVESQFSGFRSLWNDVKNAPTLKDKILYFIMPPGWKHNGRHETVAVLRRQKQDNAAVSHTSHATDIVA